MHDLKPFYVLFDECNSFKIEPPNSLHHFKFCILCFTVLYIANKPNNDRKLEENPDYFGYISKLYII